MQRKLIKKLSMLYRKRELATLKNILKRKGVDCSLTLTAIQNEDNSEFMHNYDPTQQDVEFIGLQYANNQLSSKTIKSKILFLKRESELFTESSWVDIGNRDESSLRDDYIAYIDYRGMLDIGTLIVLEDLEDSMYLIHRAYRHRDLSDVFRYALSREIRNPV